MKQTNSDCTNKKDQEKIPSPIQPVPEAQDTKASAPRETLSRPIAYPFHTSSRAGEIKRAAEIAKSTPDVRMHKIKSLKQSLKSGTLTSQSDKVAEKILEGIRKDLEDSI